MCSTEREGERERERERARERERYRFNNHRISTCYVIVVNHLRSSTGGRRISTCVYYVCVYMYVIYIYI